MLGGDGWLGVRLVHPSGVGGDVMAAVVEGMRERLGAVPGVWVTVAAPREVQRCGGPPDPRSLVLVATGSMAALGEAARRAAAFPYAGMVDVAVLRVPQW